MVLVRSCRSQVVVSEVIIEAALTIADGPVEVVATLPEVLLAPDPIVEQARTL